MIHANNSRILVVTPTLGDSPFLDETVASVATQTVRLQHVLAAPATKVAALQQRFPHVRVCVDAGREGGIYGALNAALAAYPGGWDWFTYINDDDTLLPAFSTMLDEEENSDSEAEVVYGDVELIREDGSAISRITIEQNPVWIPALLQQGISPLMQQGMLFRRSVVRRIRGFDTRYRLCADLDFWLRAYVGGARFRAHPLRVAQFRLRPGQLSGNTLLTEREQAAIVARHLPCRLPRMEQRLARWRYRWRNLPRYLARVRRRGFRTSYGMLETAEVRR